MVKIFSLIIISRKCSNTSEAADRSGRTVYDLRLKLLL